MFFDEIPRILVRSIDRRYHWGKEENKQRSDRMVFVIRIEFAIMAI